MFLARLARRPGLGWENRVASAPHGLSPSIRLAARLESRDQAREKVRARAATGTP